MFTDGPCRLPSTVPVPVVLPCLCSDRFPTPSQGLRNTTVETRPVTMTPPGISQSRPVLPESAHSVLSPEGPEVLLLPPPPPRPPRTRPDPYLIPCVTTSRVPSSPCLCCRAPSVRLQFRNPRLSSPDHVKDPPIKVTTTPLGPSTPDPGP